MDNRSGTGEVEAGMHAPAVSVSAGRAEGGA